VQTAVVRCDRATAGGCGEDNGGPGRAGAVETTAARRNRTTLETTTGRSGAQAAGSG
jgi:hypothetical protein